MHFLLKSQKYDFVFISETWLSDDFPLASLESNGYKILAKNRSTRGGGVAVLFRNTFACSVININIISEILCFECSGIRFCVCYRPPGENTQELKSFLSDLSLFCKSNHPLIIVGDFNVKNICWINYVAQNQNSFSVEFLSFIFLENLYQWILEPTHTSGAILDLVCSRDLNLCNVKVDLPFSDHNSILFDVPATAIETSCDKELVRDYKHADWTGIFKFLSGINFNNIFSGQNSEEISNTLTGILNFAIDNFVPLIEIKKFRKSKHWSVGTLEAYRKSELALRRFHRSKSLYNKFAKNVAQATFRRLARRDKKNQEMKLFRTEKGNFYKFIQQQSNQHFSIPDLVDDYGNSVSSPALKTEMFGNFFGSVFSTDDGHLPILNWNKSYPTVSDIFCTEFEIFNILKNLPSKYSCGPDGINNVFLKKCAYFLAYPLYLLFNSVFETGKVPSHWKKAHIVPLFKKGDRKLVKNYRPVSLTSNIAKIAEKHVHFLVSQHCHANSIISSKQHGFCSGKSTVTQIFSSVHFYTEQINQKGNTDVIYMDLAKAFDSVCHEKLIHKLKGYGFSGNLLQFLKNFLQNRLQSVKIGRYFSKEFKVKSGVPQGTVLGPLLFSLYINDSVNELKNSEILLFADDCKIYKGIKNSVDQNLLQEDLSHFANWCNTWQLNLALEKCCFHSVGFRNDLESSYILDDHYLEYEQYVRDLGIFIDDTLKFNYHVQQLIRKAYACSFKLLKIFTSRDEKLMKSLFLTFVLPILEYGSVIWNSFLSLGDTQLIEKVQRRFTKKINGFSFLSYENRLSRLGIHTLQKRRENLDMLFLHKLINNCFDIDCSKFVSALDPSNRRHYDPCKLRLPPCARTTRSGLICTTKQISTYNELPLEIRRLCPSKFFKEISKF